MNLADMHCTDPGPDARALTENEIAGLQPQLPDWTIVPSDTPYIERMFTFANFVQALAFANAVGAMAEAEGHHPAMLVEWGRVRVMWWTHSVSGLHRNDFIAAAKTDRLYHA